MNVEAADRVSLEAAHCGAADLPEVVAVVLPEGEGGDGTATVVLRARDGTLQVRTMHAREVLADRHLLRGCVRRGKPIVDPQTRTVLGYEMEDAGTRRATG